MSTPSKQKTLNDLLKANLADYVTMNSEGSNEDYKVKRELAIARLALEEGTKAFIDAVQNLRPIIDTILIKVQRQLDLNQNSNDSSQVNIASTISKVDSSELMASINTALQFLQTIEERSNRTASLSLNVSKVAKAGAEIEALLSSKLDVLQIYSIITQLPQLILQITKTILSQEINSILRQRINGEPITFSFLTTQVLTEAVFSSIASLVANNLNEQIENSVSVLTYRDQSSLNANATNNGGVIEAQVVRMLNSVPTTVDVVETREQLPEVIQQLL